jgi:hypothetical protein
MAYLEGNKNVWKRLSVSVMEVNGKPFNRNNSHYSFQHWNNSPYTKENRKEELTTDNHRPKFRNIYISHDKK